MRMRTVTIIALSAAVISGTANFVNKFALSGFGDPVLFTSLKNLLAAIFVIGIIFFFAKTNELRNLTAKQWGKLFLIGILGGSVPFALFFTGLSQTTAVNAALIHKTLFVWIALLGIPFLKEKTNWQQWLGIGVIFIANLFVGGFTGFKANAGELMILAATILWAVESVFAKKLLSEVSEFTLAAGRMVFGSIILLSYVSITTGFSPVLNTSATSWGWVILTAALLGGYVLTWFAALKRAPATYVATLLVPATLVTNMLSAVFITHAFSGLDVMSAVFYTAGIGLLIYFYRPESTSQPVYMLNAIR